MKIKIIALVVAIIFVGIVLLSTDIIFNSQNDSSTVLLTSKLPDSKLIDQILKEDVIGYGFVWLFSDDKLSSNGILTNIHIENGKIVDTWHNELIATNYAYSDSFCIDSHKLIGSVKVENDQIITIVDSENNPNELEFSENYLTVKLVNDSDCYYHIRAIIIQNQIP